MLFQHRGFCHIGTRKPVDGQVSPSWLWHKKWASGPVESLVSRLTKLSTSKASWKIRRSYYNNFSHAEVADFIQNLSRWKLFYERLPLESQGSIRKITSPQKKNPLLKVQRVRKFDIGIFKKLWPHFQSWRNSKTFLDNKSSSAAKAVASAQDPVSQVYVKLRRIVDRRIDDLIRERIYAVALFDLRLLLNKGDSLHLRLEVREMSHHRTDEPMG